MLTTIHGTDDKNKIKTAVHHYLDGLLTFVNPDSLANSKRPNFSKLSTIRESVRDRYADSREFITEIIWSINQRAKLINSKEYLDLSSREELLWSKGEKVHFEVGVRACVDAGLTREAVAGTKASLGRSLAGDDELVYVEEVNEFRLAESVMKKKLIHAGRGGRKEFLEILIEHTECGRRGQMLANLKANSDVTKNFEIVFANIEVLLSAKKLAEKVKEAWQSGKMEKDKGVWAGIWIKKAQRQAYQAISEVKLFMPILLYDKMDGNFWAGIDNENVLCDENVLKEGGFTHEVLTKLEQEGKIWSLKAESAKWLKLIQKLGIKKGAYTFTQLQNNWLEVKKAMFEVCKEMWEKSSIIQESIEKLLAISNVKFGSKMMERRYIHQVWRMFSYAYVLNTFEKGNAPGHHMEDHLASGESAVLGVKEHLPLGQGGLQLPTSTEFFTGRSVLLHSKPGKEGRPIVVLMKHDTSEPDAKPLSGEETQRAMDDFMELLKLWPYVVVGDMIPVVIVRNKVHLGISRLALSVVLSFGDIVLMAANSRIRPGDRDVTYGAFAEVVPATNKVGEVIMVPASEILKIGIETKNSLIDFRAKVTELADWYSNVTVQSALRAVIS